MSFTRIIGRNEHIYRKFGDYCLSEATSGCLIVCSTCQDEYHSEQTFWAHVSAAHNHTPPLIKPLQATMKHEKEQQTITNTSIVPTNVAKKCKIERAAETPKYIEAEYLEGMDLNDPEALLDLQLSDATAAAFFGQQQQNVVAVEPVVDHSNAEPQQTLPKPLPNTQAKLINIDSISTKSMLNCKLLKRLFQQTQRTSNELKYQLNMLKQEVKSIEQELKKDPLRTRKCFMKILPEKPFTTRDEVLILDEELHRSKEMRECLHDEAMQIIADSADTFCRILWRFVMCDNVANQFCWRGVVDGSVVIKYPVRDMTITEVFQAAFREKFPTQTINFFKDRTMTHFNKAQERVKRVTSERKRGHELPNNKFDIFKRAALEQQVKNSDSNSLAACVEEEDAFEDVFC